MTKLNRISCFLVCLFISTNSFSQITLEEYSSLSNNDVAVALIDSIMGAGISYSNVSFQGVRYSSSYQTAYFTTTGVTETQMGISKGVALCTGQLSLLPLNPSTDPASSNSFSKGYTSGTPGEIRKSSTSLPDMDLLAGGSNWFNGAILEFDFVPLGDSIQFKYVFGGEEYTDNTNWTNYQCSSYNDKFGFLISGPGIIGGAGYTNDAKNIARLSNGSEVGINSVNNGVVGSSGGSPSASTCEAANPEWVENVPVAAYNGPIYGTALNGNTDVLIAAQGGLTPGATYHIKLMILDVADGAYDAIVYLEAGSFTSPEPSLTVEANPGTICSGEDAYVVATNNYGTAPYTFEWSNSTSTNGASNADSILVSPTANQSYSVTVTDAEGNVNTGSATVTVQPSVTPIFDTYGPYCQNATPANLPATSNNGITGSWSPSAINTNTANTTTYTFTPDAGQCAEEINVEVIVNPTPVANAGENQAVCAGEEVTLTATGNGTYSWSNSVNQGVAFTPGATATYTVTVENTYGCYDTDQVTVTVNPVPDTDAGLDVEICEGETTQLEAGTGTSYHWEPSTGLNADNVSNPNASPVSTTTYIVTVSNAAGCYDTDTVVVTVNENPQVSAGNDTTIIYGTNAYLNGTATGASGNFSWDWTPQDSLMNHQIEYPTTIDLTQTNDFTLTVTDNETGCTGSDDVTVTVTGTPFIVTDTITDPTYICSGDSYTIHLSATGGSGNYTYTWDTGNPADTTANLTVSPTSTESYTATVTDGYNSQVSITTINVYPEVNANAGSDAEVCFGDNYQLEASGGTQYHWSPALSLDNQDIYNPTASPANTTSYVVTVTDEYQCSNTDTVTLTVNPLPVLSINQNDNEICLNNTTNFTGNVSGGSGAFTQYEWAANTVNGTFDTPDEQNTEFTGTISGQSTITFTVTDNAGCVGTATSTIMVNPLPVVSTLNDTAICFGESVSLWAEGGESYQWIPSTGLNFNDVNNPVASPQTNTDYSVVVTSAAGCSDTGYVTVTINPLPIINAGQDQTIPYGASTNLNGTVTSPSSNYNNVWAPADSVFDASNLGTATVNLHQTNTFTLTVTDEATGCVNTDNVNIVVSGVPLSVNDSINQPAEICLGDSAWLEVNPEGGSGSYSYNWSTGNIADTTSGIWVNPNAYAQYIVTVTDGFNYVFGTMDVIVHDLPNVTVSNDTSVCPGNEAELWASGGSSYFWYPTSGLSSSNTETTVATPQISRYYYVEVENEYGCLSTDSVYVNLFPVPFANAGNDTTICEDETAIINAAGSTGTNPLEYNWEGYGANSYYEISPDATADYYLTVTDANGCVDFDTVTVNVNPLPVININLSDSTICRGEEVTLDASESVGATNLVYQWNHGLGSGPIKTDNPDVTTTYTVIATDLNKCSNSGDITIYVNIPPVADLGNDTTICANESISLSADASTGENPLTYEWYNGETTTDINVTPESSQTYSVEVTDVNGCTDTDEIIVTVNPVPVIVLTGSEHVCEGDSAFVDASGSTGTGTLSYSWDSFDETGNKIEFLPEQNTNLMLTITDSLGCVNQGSFSIQVHVKPEITIEHDGDNMIYEGQYINFTLTPDYYNEYIFTNSNQILQQGENNVYETITTLENEEFFALASEYGCLSDTASLVLDIHPLPNAFTPNGDGVNDIFMEGMQMTIINKWGQELFSGNQGWDGRYNNKVVAPGTYYYIIQFDDLKGAIFELKGTVVVN